MATNACANVEIKYKGNGTLKQFTFPFTYIKASDVVVALWDDTTRDYIDEPSTSWKFANATTIEFTTPPQSPTDPKIFNIRIYRDTDISTMEAQFYPGSAIRAEDLNDDFDQLRLAIEEGRCRIPQAVYNFLTDNYWNKGSETITGPLQKTLATPPFVDDKHILTAAALSERFDVIMSDNVPPNPPITEGRQPGKIWIDTQALQIHYWEPAANAWINLANTGPQGPQGVVGPTGTFQTIVSDIKPTVRADGTPLKDGDLWFNKNNANLYAYYNDGDSTQWVSISKAGPQGPAGPTGAASTVPGPIGPVGPQGPAGTGAMPTIIGHSPITATTVGAQVDFTFDPIPLTTLP